MSSMKEEEGVSALLSSCSLVGACEAYKRKTVDWGPCSALVRKDEAAIRE